MHSEYPLTTFMNNILLIYFFNKTLFNKQLHILVAYLCTYGCYIANSE